MGRSESLSFTVVPDSRYRIGFSCFNQTVPKIKPLVLSLMVITDMHSLSILHSFSTPLCCLPIKWSNEGGSSLMLPRAGGLHSVVQLFMDYSQSLDLHLALFLMAHLFSPLTSFIFLHFIIFCESHIDSRRSTPCLTGVAIASPRPMPGLVAPEGALLTMAAKVRSLQESLHI